MPANTGGNQGRDKRGRFKAGHSGNSKGKPPGARHKSTMAALALLSGEAKALTRKAVKMALAGDVVALRLCLTRLLPTVKDRPIRVDLPALDQPEGAVAATAAILELVGAGELTPSEAANLAGLVDVARRTMETADLAARLERIEKILEVGI